MTQAAQHTKYVDDESRSKNMLNLSSKIYDTQTWINEAINIQNRQEPFHIPFDNTGKLWVLSADNHSEARIVTSLNENSSIVK
jgi:hypothetical protein